MHPRRALGSRPFPGRRRPRGRRPQGTARSAGFRTQGQARDTSFRTGPNASPWRRPPYARTLPGSAASQANPTASSARTMWRSRDRTARSARSCVVPRRFPCRGARRPLAAAWSLSSRAAVLLAHSGVFLCPPHGHVSRVRTLKVTARLVPASPRDGHSMGVSSQRTRHVLAMRAGHHLCALHHRR